MQTNSAFSTFLYEIRLMANGCMLAHHQPLGSQTLDGELIKSKMDISILTICKQIHFEANKTLYTSNFFLPSGEISCIFLSSHRMYRENKLWHLKNTVQRPTHWDGNPLPYQIPRYSTLYHNHSHWSQPRIAGWCHLGSIQAVFD
jgi:hypothetical protein